MLVVLALACSLFQFSLFNEDKTQASGLLPHSLKPLFVFSVVSLTVVVSRPAEWQNYEASFPVSVPSRSVQFPEWQGPSLFILIRRDHQERRDRTGLNGTNEHFKVFKSTNDFKVIEIAYGKRGRGRENTGWNVHRPLNLLGRRAEGGGRKQPSNPVAYCALSTQPKRKREKMQEK